MKVVLDSAGRILIPKALRDALGLRPGSTVELSRYGGGINLLPSGRTARLVERNGKLVATGTTRINDETVLALLDAGRR